MMTHLRHRSLPWLAGVSLAACGSAAPATMEPSLIIDTDAGIDDLMAIAFLLASPAVRIEAITIGTGLANVEPGVQNVLRLLALAGRDEIPVHRGRATPIAGDRAFPTEWRGLTDALPGVDCPRRGASPRPRPPPISLPLA